MIAFRITHRFFRLATGVFFCAALSGPLFAEDITNGGEALLHQQNFENPSGQIHAYGKDKSPQTSFSEKYASPENFTTFSKPLEDLFVYTSWTTFIFFVIMAGALGVFMVIYRQRPGHTAYYTHGTSSANKGVRTTLDLAVFISLDIVLMLASWRDPRNFIWNYPDGPEVVKIMVMPQQWAWNFKYPGIDGKFGTEDDIDTINDLRVPKGRPISLQIKSKDVIHGFFIPQVRMQIDAIPGVITKFWFDATKTGNYEIACYHHCGTAHYKMKAFLKVLEPNDYESWIQENSDWARAKFDPEDKFIQWGWRWAPDNAPAKTAVNNLRR